jgi:hypothetical protein
MGFEFGLQAEVDPDGLVTSVPPPANAPVSRADDLLYLSTTTVSYLFDVGKGLLLTGGLLSAYIAYESFLARDNPNYTRGYLTDYVPYYLWGVQASYPLSDRLIGDLILMTGYNYLANPNENISYGVQLIWQPQSAWTAKQNIYFGPDQAETGISCWRFFSDTIIEWKSEKLLLAASFDFGTERQAWLASQPRFHWLAGALWGQVLFQDSWRVGLRPEFYSDPDGLMTGARQTLWAITATVEYTLQWLANNDLSARLEYRLDRSTGEGGGFYAGADNHLVPNQNLFMVAVIWSWDWTPGLQRDQANDGF